MITVMNTVVSTGGDNGRPPLLPNLPAPEGHTAGNHSQGHQSAEEGRLRNSR